MTVTFEDLPMDVLEKVVGKSSLRDCLTLRKVCKDLRNLVDSSEINCDSLDFEFTSCSFIVKFENQQHGYVETRDGGCEISSFNSATSITKIYRDDRDYKQTFIADTLTFLNNRKLNIDRLSLFFKTPTAAAECSEFLKSLNSPLIVRSIESRDLEHLHSIVPLLKQEKLEAIIFKNSYFNVAEFNEISKSDAAEILKNPKLKIYSMNFDEYSDESSAEFSKNLKSLDSPLRFESIYIWGGQEEWIIPALQSLDPEKVEEILLICVKFTIDQFNELAGMEQWKKVTKLVGCFFPHMIRLEHFVNFKEFQFKELNITDESLITIRDIILKSPHFQKCRLVDKSNKIRGHRMYEKLDRIFGQDPAYDSRTWRFTIPDSLDYFELRLDETPVKIYLTIRRTSEN